MRHPTQKEALKGQAALVERPQSGLQDLELKKEEEDRQLPFRAFLEQEMKGETGLALAACLPP